MKIKKKFPLTALLCLFCLCALIAGCVGGAGNDTADRATDPAPETSAPAPEQTSGEETTSGEITEETTNEITDETTDEMTAPPPAPEEADVFVHGYGGEALKYTVKIGETVSDAALEAAQLPPINDDVKSVLIGWEYSIDENGARLPYDTSAPPAVNAEGMHLYAIFEYSFRVSFAAGDGAFAENTETSFFVKSGASVSAESLLAAMPVKASTDTERFVFSGFESGGKIYAVNDAFKVSEPIAFVASFRSEPITYTVIAHTEYGTLPNGKKTEMFSGNYAQAAAFVAKYNEYRPADVISGALRYSFERIELTENGSEWLIELIWKADFDLFTVTFDRADGNPPMVSYVGIGGKIILPSDEGREDAVRYYDFVGWRDESGLLYNGGYELTVTENTVFKAEFVPGDMKVYKVTFITEVGKFASGTASVVLTGHYGDTIVPPAPPSISDLTFGEVVYEFSGWNTEVGASFTENASYTARYTTQNKVYFLSFYIDGKLWQKVPHYAGVALQAPERPAHTLGKIFSGWSDLPNTMPESDLSLHAATRNAEVIYVLDGEVISRNEVSVGTVVTVAAPAQKHGYTVSGWVSSDIDSIGSGGFTMPERDVVFTAVSTPKPHTVTYIIEGNVIYTDHVKFGDFYTLRGIEVKRGYVFTGWKVQENAVDPALGVFAIPDADIVFVGAFDILSYNVNYYLEGELLYTDTYRFGDNVTLRPDEFQEGCTFSWNSAAVSISNGGFIMPACDVDVYGAFSGGGNKIIFMIDGVEYGTIGAEAGKKLSISFWPTKTGYTFSGWQSDEVDVSMGEFVMPEGDLVLRGSFVPNAHSVLFIDISSGTVLGTSYLDYGSAFSFGDRRFCAEGKISTGMVLLAGEAVRDGEFYIMPDEDVVFGLIWADCLTLEVDEGYFVPYYFLLEEEFAGCRYSESEKTVYISDPAIKVAGESAGITVVYEY